MLIQGGLDPSDSDPRFHQQMVYAVAMKVVENFERALGRPFQFSGGDPLTVLPHAFEGENAFYDPATRSLLFGYFTADAENVGANLPGQTVFTCLSHDIIAHETTHAIVDRLRRRFNEPTNRDVIAFHEGLADIVAIFQHFSFPEVLRHEIRATRNDLSQPGRLLELARQFGYGTGSGRALRTAAGIPGEEPDPRLYDEVIEPHERGSILVAAVFDASSGSTATGSPTSSVPRRGVPGSCPPGNCRPTCSTSPPARRRPRPRTCSRCACAPSSTSRRSTSRSATTSGRS